LPALVLQGYNRSSPDSQSTKELSIGVLSSFSVQSRYIMFRIFTILFACLLMSVGVLAQKIDRPLLISRVAINQSLIAFTYAGKIWLVERTGGTARRLTNTPNDETSPVFSPDGQR